MSYASALAIFIFVLTPLLLPLTISGVHAIAKWEFANCRKNTGPKSPAVTSN